jgi:hypothetical protein
MGLTPLTQDDDDDIYKAVTAIREGKVLVQSDDGSATVKGHLVLPEGLYWPNATNNKLFVREFYEPLYEHVLRECKRALPGEQADVQRKIISGQPGIGKTVFG